MIYQSDVLKSQEVDLETNGGKGKITVVQLVNNEDVPHGRAFQQVVMGQGTAMPYHTHHDETEYYHIIAGEGVVTTDEGEVAVGVGTVVSTGDSESHSIRNDREEDLVFTALILND